MLEIIKKQFESGKTLTQSRYYNYANRGLWPKFYWDLYPLAQEYYHELNPYFLFNLYRPELYRFSKLITARDGYVNFATFLLDNLTKFAKLKTGPIFIHPDLAPLVPPTLAEHFGCWHIVQPKQLKLEEAKKVIIFGLVSEEYLGEMDKFPERLKQLKKINPEASIELWIPMRKDIFGRNNRESLVVYHVMDCLKDALPGRKLKILRGEHFFEKTDLKNTFVYDLELDKILVADSYLHYFTQTRGATVNNNSLLTPPDDSMFNLDLSMHHQIHYTPLPQVDSIFTDLLFYKKKNPSIKDLAFDPFFQNMLRTGLKK